jgi:hypothetical protein
MNEPLCTGSFKYNLFYHVQVIVAEILMLLDTCHICRILTSTFYDLLNFGSIVVR